MEISGMSVKEQDSVSMQPVEITWHYIRMTDDDTVRYWLGVDIQELAIA